MDKITSPLKAIKAKCLECSCDNSYEVKMCEIKDCPLYDFRFGKNPYRKHTMTEEQKAAAAERMRAMRQKDT